MLTPKKNNRPLITIILFTLIWLASFEQLAIAQNAARPDRGIAPGHTYAVSDIENISLTNGNLNLSIPLASLPPVSGGKLSWAINAVYNSKGWDVKRKEKNIIVPGDQPTRFMEEIPQVADIGYTSGWVVGGIYTLVGRESRDDVDWINDPPEGNFNWYKVIFTTPDGATHELKPVDYQPNYGNRIFLFGLYSQTPNTIGSPMRYYSSDGSFLWAYIYNTGSIFWRVYMKDGTQIIQYSNGVQRIVDTNIGNSSQNTPNQNSIKIFTDSDGTTTTRHYQDERTGREIRMVTALNGDVTVQYQTVGGNWVDINLMFGTTTVFGQIFEQTSYAGPDQTCQRKQVITSVDMQVLKEIRYPQTQPGQPQRKFTFSYNSDTALSVEESWNASCFPNTSVPVTSHSKGWGELSQMIMPSGAKVTYAYTGDAGNYIGSSDNIPRVSVYSKTLEHDDLPLETWAYSIGYNGGSVTAPDGAVTTEQIYSHDYAYGWSHNSSPTGVGGLSYRTNRSGPVITERRWIGLKFNGGQNLAPSGFTTFNPVVDTEYTTLKENDQAIKMSARKYQYDYNGNVTQTTEYDWFDPALVVRDAQGIPLSVPNGVPILRTTTTEYYNSADMADSPNVYAKRVMTTQPSPLILSAPKQSINGSSQTQYRYDNLAYGTAPTVGQLTHLSRWDNIASAWQTVTNQYGDYGNLSSTTDANNNTTTFTWDTATQANLTQITVNPGTGTQTVTRTFDFSTGSTLSVTDANGKITENSYLNTLLNAPDPFLRPGVITAPAVTSVVNGVSTPNQRRRIKTTYFDATRQVLTESDLNLEDDKKLKSRTTYDQLGRAVLSESNEDGTVNYTISSQTIYVQPGLITLTSNPKRSAAAITDGWTRATNDTLGRTIEVVAFSGATPPPTSGTNGNWMGTVTTSYYADQTTVTDQAGKMRRSLTDGAGRLSQVIEDPNGLNYTTSYNYDQLNNLIRVAQGTQRRWFAYDSMSRLIRARNPEQNTFPFVTPVSVAAGNETNNIWSQAYAYDPNGNLASKQDARGVSTSYQYDGLNRNTLVNYGGSTPDVTRTYDTATLGKGRLRETESLGPDNSRTTINAFDALGRPLSQTQSFWNGSVWVNYNVQQSYNLAGAVTGQTYPSGRTTAMVYDSAGRLNSFKGTLGDGNLRDYAIELSYAATGQLVKEKFGTTPTPLYHQMSYNNRQQLYDIRLGTSGAANLGDPATKNRGLLEIYYGTNPVAYGNDGTNNNGNVYRLDHVVPLDDNFQRFTDSVSYYHYDELNRIISVNELPIASWVSETGGWLPQSYAQRYKYDRWGNRTIDTPGTWGIGINRKAFDVNTSNNRLTVPVGQTGTMNYDAAGNLTFDSYTGMGERNYDADNQMATATGNNGLTNSYTHDGDGRRVRRQVWENGVLQNYWQVYGLGSELVGEYKLVNSTPVLQKEYGYRGGQLLMVYDASETGNKQWQWLVTDHLGTPRMIADLSGSLAGMKRQDYLPFGEEIMAGTGVRDANYGYTVDQVRQQFTGYERDNETGLDFAQARYYANVQGRFTSPDNFSGGPVEVFGPGKSNDEKQALPYADIFNPQSLNQYQYCLNNSLRYVDPEGHQPSELENIRKGLKALELSRKTLEGLAKSPNIVAKVTEITLEGIFGPRIYFSAGGLSQAESKFALEVAVYSQRSFMGVAAKNAPGIDGASFGLLTTGGISPDIQLISLKETTGGLSAILKHASSAETQAAAAGYQNVDLYIKSTNQNVDVKTLADFIQKGAAQGNGGIAAISKQGTIQSVTIFAQDGAVKVAGGKVVSCDSNGNCK